MTPEREQAVDYETHVCCGHEASGSPIYKVNEHARNCPGGDQCTCGLRQRISLSTEKSMHAAWRKRAEEAETALIASESEKDRMRQALEVLEELRKLLLDQPWHQRCEIIPDYMPPYPGKDTRQTLQVRYNNGAEYPPFLRYSKGPNQGFFWDVYGDHLHSEALALIAIHQAPAPVDVGPVVFSLPLKSLKEESHD